MFTSLLLAVCALLAPVQEKKPPSEERIAAAIADLEKALGKDATKDGAARALRASLEVVDARVIDVIDERGLRHADPEVRGVAVETLGRMDHPDALTALHEALKRDRKELQETPPRYAALLRAIARHGKESSIPTLVEDLFQSPDRSVISARILGLGHVRSPKAVEELIRLMRSAPRPRVGDHMVDFRLALVVLTGEDKGTDQELWINWYGDHKSKLEVAPETPELPRELRRRWNVYWGEKDGEKDDDEEGAGKERRKGKER
jgi:hypothetical protein